MLTGGRLREKVKPFVPRMAAIGEIHRLSVVYLLSYDPMEVGELAEAINIPINLLSHHLKVLLNAGWVVKSKFGRRVTYQLNEKAFFELKRLLADTPFDRQVLSK